MKLVTEIYETTESFPRREIYGLTNQLRRASVSIASNIAEGQGPGTSKDFCSFLWYAYGSVQEVETQLIIANRLGYMDDAARIKILELCSEVARIINGLMNSLTDY